MSHHGHAHHGHGGHDDGPGHVLDRSVYNKVFVSLLVLTVITVAVSRVDFGVLNMVVAMVVASVKATIVALFFMHLKYEDKITWLFAFFPILLLFTLIGGVFTDNPLRAKPTPVVVVDTLKSGGDVAAPAAAAPPAQHGAPAHE
jgi:cytochrome c oxidase subunit 4